MGGEDRLHQPVEIGPRQRRARHQRHPARLGQRFLHRRAQLPRHLRPVLDQVPLVDREHQRPALFLHHPGELQILLLERVGRVDHEHDRLGEAHRAQRVGRRQAFELARHLRLAPETGGVDQAHCAALPGPRHGDRVAGDAGLGAGQHPLFAEQAVDQRRFAGVGPAEDRELEGAGLFAASGCAGGRFAGRADAERTERVVKPVQAFAVLGRKRDRLAEAEREGLDPSRLARASFAFVGDEDHRQTEAAKPGGEAAIERRQAGAGVDQQQHRVGAGERGFGPEAHARFEAFGRLLESGGVDDGEVEIAEARIGLAPVARHAGRVVHQGELLPRQAVEQGGLADVGPADDGDPEHGTLNGKRRCRRRWRGSRRCRRRPPAAPRRRRASARSRECRRSRARW